MGFPFLLFNSALLLLLAVFLFPERKKRGGGWMAGENLGGVRGGESVIMIYCIKNPLSIRQQE